MRATEGGLTPDRRRLVPATPRGLIGQDTCSKVCTPAGGGGAPDDDCPVPSNCLASEQPRLHDGVELGVCFTF
jgi:hypothetical protein